MGRGHIPGSVHVALPRHPRGAGRDRPRTPVAVICASGQRAAVAASLLARHGARESSTSSTAASGTWERAGRGAGVGGGVGPAVCGCAGRARGPASLQNGFAAGVSWWRPGRPFGAGVGVLEERVHTWDGFLSESAVPASLRASRGSASGGPAATRAGFWLRLEGDLLGERGAVERLDRRGRRGAVGRLCAGVASSLAEPLEAPRARRRWSALKRGPQSTRVGMLIYVTTWRAPASPSRAALSEERGRCPACTGWLGTPS